MEAPRQSAWSVRQREYRELVRARGDCGKHSYVTTVLEGLELNLGHVARVLLELKNREQDCDMQSLQLLRLLYLVHEPLPGFDRAKVVADLVAFPFWPSTSDKMRGKDASQLCFWSENHILMSLGSAHLARQLLALDRTQAAPGSAFKEEMARVVDTTPGAALEEKLLRLYLSAHTSAAFTGASGASGGGGGGGGGGAGVYEALSHVYLPYTLSALWNLFDFSLDQGVRADAGALIDAIVRSLLLTTTVAAPAAAGGGGGSVAACADAADLSSTPSPTSTPSTSTSTSSSGGGVCTLTASCRAFDRTRRRTRGHNINNLVCLLTGCSPEPLCLSSLTDFLCTTTWQPSAALLACWAFTGRLVLPCSHGAGLEAFAAAYRSGSGGGSGGDPAHPALRVGDSTKAEAEGGSGGGSGSGSSSSISSSGSGSGEDKGEHGLGALGELTPFAWSAGLVLHPAYAAHTKRYLAAKHLSRNATLGLLRLVPQALAGALAGRLAHLSAGQSYCGVTLKVFKSALSKPAAPPSDPPPPPPPPLYPPPPPPSSAAPSAAALAQEQEQGRGLGQGQGQVVLTSFDRWNVQRAGFQQLPWCLNLAGVGLWTQSGAGSEGVFGFALTNTHNPCVVQEGSVLLCAYVAPAHLSSSLSVTGGVLRLGTESWLVWPEPLLEAAAVFAADGLGARAAQERQREREQRRGRGWLGGWLGGGASASASAPAPAGCGAYGWRVGERRGCFVGVLCTSDYELSSRPFEDTRVEVVPSDLGHPLSMPVPQSDEPETVTVQCHRLICKSKAHSWVVVVATTNEFSSLREFYVQRCLAIDVRETLPERRGDGFAYACTLVDPLEGTLSVQVGQE